MLGTGGGYNWGIFIGGMDKVARWHMARVRVGVLRSEAVKVKELI